MKQKQEKKYFNIGETMTKKDNTKEVNELINQLVDEFISLRKKLGMTQMEMSENSGICREMIAVLESKYKVPNVRTLIKMLEPFGYTIKIDKIKSNNTLQ